ncbi:peptidase (PNG1) [Fusarium sp. NRRL 25303]|nr:peptidase (PNG1) [Fusarium sp. NRRL 25303]
MPLPSILKLKDDKWDNPEESIGTLIGYLPGTRYLCWEAAGPARLAFRELGPDIKDLLETSNITPADIVSWSIYMVGRNERNAAPKLLICSTDCKTRKNIRQLIKDSRIVDKYPGIGLGDVSALPDRPVIRELSPEAIEALLPFGCGIDGAVLAGEAEPAMGKRIFVVNPHDFSLRPATTGPIILHGGKCYQLTVAHAFRHMRELHRSPGQQMAEDDCDFDGMSDDERDEESQCDEMTTKGSVTPREIGSDKASFMASLDGFSGEKHSSSRSKSSLSDYLDGGNDPRLSVKSPEENLGFGEFDVSQLQFFGRLILSSLTGSNPSLDYALIETSRTADDLENSSVTLRSMVSSIGEIESDDISVVATTSPHRRVEGRLTATPSYICLPGQRTFQQVYPIRLVAGGLGTSIAYAVPAGDISRDIQARISFGLIWMPQQDGQGQRSKDDVQISTGSPPDSTNPEVSSIRSLSTPELEEPQGDPLLESNIAIQQWLQHKPNSQPSQRTSIDYQSLTEHSRSSVSGVISQPSSIQTSRSSPPTVGLY